jgi:uncharacterized coiled-coil protein SlyX
MEFQESIVRESSFPSQWGMDMDPELAERLRRIESHLAQIEHLCDQLNEVVVDHGKRLSKLAATQARLAQTIETQELERIKGTNPKPPHYQ